MLICLHLLLFLFTFSHLPTNYPQSPKMPPKCVRFTAEFSEMCSEETFLAKCLFHFVQFICFSKWTNFYFSFRPSAGYGGLRPLNPHYKGLRPLTPGGFAPSSGLRPSSPLFMFTFTSYFLYYEGASPPQAPKNFGKVLSKL